MTAPEERTYTAKEAADLLGCPASSVIHYARHFLGIHRRAGTEKTYHLTDEQIEQLRAILEQRRRELPHLPWQNP